MTLNRRGVFSIGVSAKKEEEEEEGRKEEEDLPRSVIKVKGLVNIPFRLLINHIMVTKPFSLTQQLALVMRIPQFYK